MLTGRPENGPRNPTHDGRFVIITEMFSKFRDQKDNPICSLKENMTHILEKKQMGVEFFRNVSYVV